MTTGRLDLDAARAYLLALPGVSEALWWGRRRLGVRVTLAAAG